jgi:hypothetical protein
MNYFKNTTYQLAIVLFAGLLVFSACKKDNGMDNPSANQLNPEKGSGGDVLTLTGSDLAGVTSIVFETDKVPAFFNPTLNTESAIIFRVPDTASGGQQNIVFTNSKGKTWQVPFNVIAVANVTNAFPLDFQAGSTITLTGINLESVSKVVLDGSSDEATIVSKEKKKLVLKMPSTTVNTCKLVITNSSGTMSTTQVFTYIPNAYGIFTDAFPTGMDDWSWSLTNSVSSSNVIAGSSSLQAAYNGDWGGMQLHWGTAVDLTPYKYVTFYIKGADVDKKMKFNFNWTNDQTLTIPANVWTYYKIDLGIFKNNGVSSLGTFVMQINESPKTLYFDDILLVK